MDRLNNGVSRDIKACMRVCAVYLLWHISRKGLHWSWHSSHWHLWWTSRKFMPLQTHHHL